MALYNVHANMKVKVDEEDREQKIVLANLSSKETAEQLAAWLNEYNSDLPGYKDGFFGVEEVDEAPIVEDLKRRTKLTRYGWFSFKADKSDPGEDDDIDITVEDYPKTIANDKPNVIVTALGERGVLVGIDWAKAGLTPSSAHKVASRAFDLALEKWAEYGADGVPEQGEIAFTFEEIHQETDENPAENNPEK